MKDKMERMIYIMERGFKEQLPLKLKDRECGWVPYGDFILEDSLEDDPEGNDESEQLDPDEDSSEVVFGYLELEDEVDGEEEVEDGVLDGDDVLDGSEELAARVGNVEGYFLRIGWVDEYRRGGVVGVLGVLLEIELAENEKGGEYLGLGMNEEYELQNENSLDDPAMVLAKSRHLLLGPQDAEARHERQQVAQQYQHSNPHAFLDDH